MANDALKGPEKFISQPIKVLGMDAYSAIGLIPIIIFPFAMWSWILGFVVLLSIFIASRFRLPSYQLLRYIRAKMGSKLLTPYRAQHYRERRSTRQWPY